MRMKATEASREFSALLTRVSSGETVEVDRHGEVVAVVSPPTRRTMSGSALLELAQRLPQPDDRFAEDVKNLSQIVSHTGDPWAS